MLVWLKSLLWFHLCLSRLLVELGSSLRWLHMSLWIPWSLVHCYPLCLLNLLLPSNFFEMDVSEFVLDTGWTFNSVKLPAVVSLVFSPIGDWTDVLLTVNMENSIHFNDHAPIDCTTIDHTRFKLNYNTLCSYFVIECSTSFQRKHKGIHLREIPMKQ